MPATTLGAPHTTRVSLAPVVTSTSESLSAFGCRSTLSTRAETTPVISAPGCSTPSTSRPSWFSAETTSSTGASRGVKSRIQESGARIGASVLRQEAHVAVEERLDLVDVVADHRDALEAEAEREAGVLLGVDAHALDHVGVDHPAAAELDPPRLRAHPAAGAVAEDAADRQLGRGL